jgi:protein O-GlcNAc transferase
LRRPERALDLLRQAVAIDPNNAEAHTNLGVMTLTGGNPEEAIGAFVAAVALDPGSIESQLRLALAYRRFNRPNEATAAAERAAELAPDHARAQDTLALTRRDMGRVEQAIALHRRALAIDPDFAGGWNNLGNTLVQAGRAEEAIAAFERAQGLQPSFAEPWLNLARALLAAGRAGEARAACDRYLELAPANLDGLCLAGDAARAAGDFEAAIAAYEKAIGQELDDRGAALGRLADVNLAIGRWDELASLQKQAIDLVSRGAGQRLPPFLFMRLCGDPALQCRAAIDFSAERQRAAAAFGVEFTHRAPERKRLRLGYLSADFRDHAIAQLLVEIIELHDRDRFEVRGYSLGRDDGSALCHRLAGAFDDFVDLGLAAGPAAAARIYRDEVDILIDLMGYTEGARPDILALRPAPLQVAYLGYPGTSGAAFIDYLIADALVAPPDSDKNFTEAIARLPRCYQPADRRLTIAAEPPRRSAEGLPATGVVFCCFNNGFKLGPDIFASWMRLLAASPGSVLWLLESNPVLPARLRHAAANDGIAPERLVFAARRDRPTHLARHRLADVFLDTTPYGAHTTASDALRLGVPVVSCPGEAFASRVAASLLHSLGLSELIAADFPGYEAIALGLARDPLRLAAMKARLAEGLAHSSLLDAPGHACDLEAAYERMWENWRAGRPAAAFEVARR